MVALPSMALVILHSSIWCRAIMVSVTVVVSYYSLFDLAKNEKKKKK